jgi:Ca-activated chloride channel family protein
MFNQHSTVIRTISGLVGIGLLIGATACGASYSALEEPAPAEQVYIETAEEEAASDTAYVVPAPTQTAPLAAGGSSIPNDEPYDLMYFESAGVNPFVDTEDDHLSTFAMDVDTASYTVARRYLMDGNIPPKDAIRVEEFINYFDLNYPDPAQGEGAFAIHLEGAPSYFGPQNGYLLKVDLQGKEILAENRKDAVLTFVVDVSGSMDRENRLGLVKRSLRLLVNELRPTDDVGLVVYGSRARVILEPTSAENSETILAAIDRLQPDGSTNAEEGLRLAYDAASRAYRPGAINRVILLSDGVANVGRTGPDAILEVIRDQVNQGITLSTVGFGMGNYNDILMEQLADNGDGNYAYVDNLEEAHRIFVENLTGTLQVIAKDAKIQVDFNPEVVRSYRLLGYENRAVADNDFRNDQVDAGEVGAGHSVTALYEIKFHNDLLASEVDDTALTVQIRYQDIDTGRVTEVAQPFAFSDFNANFQQTSAEFRFIAAVAEYAEILRESYWAQDSSLEDVERLALSVEANLSNNSDVIDFMNILHRAVQLTTPDSGS